MSLRNQRYARAAAYKEQWGETLEDERAEAQRQMLREGRNPNAMSNKEWQLEKEERVKANRAARGPQAYDQAQGKLIPSPRARAQANAMTQEKWDAQEEARIAQAAEDKKRQGVSAEDYWERNPTSNRAVGTANWDGHPAVQDAIVSGDISAVEAATRQAREDDRRSEKNEPMLAYKERANISAGYKGPKRTSDLVEWFSEDIQNSRAAEEAKRKAQAERRAEVVQNYRNNQKFAEAERLASRLEAKGIDQMPVKDGAPDVDRMRGMLSAATFQQWDDDKMLERSAKQVEKDTKRELRYWTQAQDGRFGVGAQNAAMSRDNQARVAQLRADVDLGENKRGSLSEPRGWRQVAERELNARAMEAAAATNFENAANAQTQSYAEAAKNLGLTIEELLKKLKDGTLTPEEQMAAFGPAAASS